MRFGSVCSGIEAASTAWEPLGWEAAWFSEIEPFPCAVLKHRYPHVPNHGDMTTLPARILAGEVEAPDVLVGGTPCQSFSVAGLRQGLKDPRGQLTRTYVEICDAIDTVRAAAGKPPVTLVYENVPGILSDRDNAFGNFLGALSGEDGALEPPGGKWTNAGLVCGPARDLAWRVLDAQYFGVAQRRRRVFLVGHSRAGSLRPVKVLLVEQGVQRHSPPSREAGQRAAAAAARGVDGGSVPTVAETLIATDYKGPGHNRDHNFIAQTFAKTDKPMSNEDAEGWSPQDHSPTITYWPRDRSDAGTDVAVVQTMSVRRLTPVECERLQGFPDEYTRIPWKNKPADQCPDGPRYKALGNSMAVPCMYWIGWQIRKAMT